jgi:hypothetical protein
MINYADERIKAINQKISALDVKEGWDRVYLQLKGIKGFWNELSWDEILIECPELEWVKEVRTNEVFRMYYKLKTDLEQLQSLEVK